MQINLNTKFNVGDEVWVVKLVPKYEVCDVCKGEKVLHFSDYDWKCQKCNGTGKLHKNKQREYIAVEAKVTSVNVTVSKDGVSTRYKIGIVGNIHNTKCSEERLFTSEESAMAWCEAENNKIRGEEENGN